MKIKKVNELNESSDFIDKGIDAIQIWTVIKYGSSDIDKIYLNKSDAEEACKFRIKYDYDYYRKINKRMSDEEFDKNFYGKNSPHRLPEVKSLVDAIDYIKDYIHDDYASHDDSNY